jgi:hypothetical protein
MKIPSREIMIAVSVILMAAWAALGQQPTPKPSKETEATDNEVVKITTKLVQLDVVVTDDDGNQVPNLGADDFEIRQDGKPQKITGISYVGSAPLSSPDAPNGTKKPEKGKIPPPPVKVRPSASSRLITFIVDDGNCQASQTGMVASLEGI